MEGFWSGVKSEVITQELDIWAFVRLMVALEEQLQHATLYALWKQEWLEIDQKLTDLANHDFDAYSDMMMNTQITLDLSDTHKAKFNETIDLVISQLKAKHAASNEPDFRADLAFEIASLQTLRNA